MKQDKQKSNWIIGAALLGGFLLSMWLDLTGLPVHQWLGVAVGALAIYHLVRHWRWVVAVTDRFIGRTSRQSRTFYIIDAGVASGFAAILVTGLVISTWLDLALGSYAIWRDVHVVASVATLALVVIKIGVHWRWIASVARRSIFTAPAPGLALGTGAGRPAPVAVQVGRRDFMRLMAGVGAVALLAGVNALGGRVETQAEAATATQTASGAVTQTASSTRTQAAAASSAPSTACTVRCNKRCSYPGRCRKYADSNKNGRCDLGECLS